MQFKVSLLACTVVGWTAVAGTARAADDMGPYIGASIGRSHLTAGGDRIDRAFNAQGLTTSTALDRNDTAYALTLGYRVNPYLAVETNYVDFGKYSLNSAVSAPAADTLRGRFKADGFDLVAVGILPLEGGFSAYGKLGALWSKAKLDAASTGAVSVSNTSHSNTGATFGLGLGYDLNRNVSTSLEWNRYDHVGEASSTGRTNFDLYSVGIKYRF